MKSKKGLYIMNFTEDEIIFLNAIHEENFEKDFLTWIELMELQFA